MAAPSWKSCSPKPGPLLLESGGFHEGAATEGRPYSTFRSVPFVLRLGNSGEGDQIRDGEARSGASFRVLAKVKRFTYAPGRQ